MAQLVLTVASNTRDVQLESNHQQMQLNFIEKTKKKKIEARNGAIFEEMEGSSLPR